MLSPFGPVPEDGVDPLFRVNLKSAFLSCVHEQNGCFLISKVQSYLPNDMVRKLYQNIDITFNNFFLLFFLGNILSFRIQICLIIHSKFPFLLILRNIIFEIFFVQIISPLKEISNILLNYKY